MSETAEQTFQPPQSTAAARRTTPIIWLVVLLIAVAAFAATVAYSGGINEVLKLVGLESLIGGSSQDSPTPPVNKPGGVATASATTTGSVSASQTAAATGTAPAKTPSATTAAAVVATKVLPSSARSAMYLEQLQSQGSIVKLVDNQIKSLKFGTPAVQTSSATVPVTVTYRSGSTVSGTMTFKKYNGLWYFFSLTASGGGTPTRPGSIDSAIVSVITGQQATPANQDMIKYGILGGGFKTATVSGVSRGSSTATVNVNLTGGSARSKRGQFVCISKKDGASTYWFVARFTSK